MGKGNILIADDDAAIRTVLNQALARAGYAPRATGNAATLWRWTLQRRRWRMLGFVIGDDAETAERRFFAEWAKAVTPAAPAAPPAAPEPQYAAPVRRGPPSGSDVIGLFPEPGSSP